MDEPLLDTIYETVLRPAAWDEVLRRLADAVGAEGGVLLWQDLFTNAAKGVFGRIDPEAVSLFSGHFATRNPLRAGAAEVRRALNGWTPRVVRDEDRLAKAEFVRTEFYNDFFRRFDFHASLAVGLEVEGRNGGTLDLLKSRRGPGEFTDDDVAFVQRVHPHLRRAFRAGRETAALRSGLSDSERSVFDDWPRGAIVAAADRRVLYMNPVAEAIARAGVGVRVVNGVLSAVHAEAVQRLEALIQRATDPDPSRRAGGFLAAPAGPDQLPLTLSVTPLRAQAHPLFSEPAVFVVVNDPSREIALTPDRLREAFGLTASEIKVALGLFAGRPTAEVAEQLGISVNTVRNHLARILEKTHASGQAELSRRMMSLA